MYVRTRHKSVTWGKTSMPSMTVKWMLQCILCTVYTVYCADADPKLQMPKLRYAPWQKKKQNAMTYSPCQQLFFCRNSFSFFFSSSDVVNFAPGRFDPPTPLNCNALSQTMPVAAVRASNRHSTTSCDNCMTDSMRSVSGLTFHRRIEAPVERKKNNAVVNFPSGIKKKKHRYGHLKSPCWHWWIS